MTSPSIDAGDAESTLRHTPLHARHLELGATMADFGGWEMPIEYAGTVAEHTAVREAVGLFDVSHMGKVAIFGPGAAEFVNAVFANDLGRIEDGQAQYSLLCNDGGGVIDDVIVYKWNNDGIYIVPNAANSPTVVEILRQAAPDGISIDDQQLTHGIIAVQGPESRALLDGLGLPTSMDYMAFTMCEWQGAPVTVCRSGYTGELGFELIAPNAVLTDLWDALLAAADSHNGGAAGLGARDTLRTEMGYPLHGHELSPDITPVQARLGWAIGWDKPDFMGAGALRVEREQGPRRVLRGLLATGRGIPRAQMVVRDAQGQTVGETTSGTFSPTLRQGIALALLDPSVAEGDTVIIDVRGRDLPCVVAKPPFVASHVR